MSCVDRQDARLFLLDLTPSPSLDLQVLTGAGVSAESGIPTFRDPADGRVHSVTSLTSPHARSAVSTWYPLSRLPCRFFQALGAVRPECLRDHLGLRPLPREDLGALPRFPQGVLTKILTSSFLFRHYCTTRTLPPPSDTPPPAPSPSPSDTPLPAPCTARCQRTGERSQAELKPHRSLRARGHGSHQDARDAERR